MGYSCCPFQGKALRWATVVVHLRAKPFDGLQSPNIYIISCKHDDVYIWLVVIPNKKQAFTPVFVLSIACISL